MPPPPDDSRSPGKGFQPFTLGRYQVLAPLNSGGMARVYLAEQRGAGGFAKRVVIKLIHEKHANDDRFVKMFVDEARIAVNLKHANVVQVLELQQEASGLFMVLEYVDGPDLNMLFNGLVRAGERMPVDLALAVLNHVLAGLAHAHQAKGPGGEPLHLIHRDITPANVLVSRSGEVKLSDFGVARAAGRLTKTAVGEIKGKYAYMAPEVMRRDEFDQRSDLFGVAVVLWEALTTRPLFYGKTDFAVMEGVLHGKVPPPSQYNPNVSKDLDAVVLKGLERDVSLRWQNAKDFKRALAPFLPREDPDALTERLAALVVQHGGPPVLVHALPPLSADPELPPLAKAPKRAKTLRFVPQDFPPVQPPGPSAWSNLPPAAAVEATGPNGTPTGGPPAPGGDGDAPGFRRTDPAMQAVTDAPPLRESITHPGALAWVQPPGPGEAGFHAVVGADKSVVGPLSVASALMLLQRPQWLPSDRLGMTALTLVPLPDVGRLLMLDHLVRPPASRHPPSRTGILREDGVAAVLLDLVVNRRSGQLQVRGSRPEQAVDLYVLEGCLQYAFRPDPAENLLSAFLRLEEGSAGELPQVLSLVLRDRLPLPRALAKVTRLTAKHISTAVDAMNRGRAMDALSWEGARYAFHPGLQHPYELPVSRDSLLGVLPAVLARVHPPEEIPGLVSALMERPLVFHLEEPRLLADLGVTMEGTLLRQALTASPRLSAVWRQLAPPGSPDEQRLLLVFLVLERCGILRPA